MCNKKKNNESGNISVEYLIDENCIWPSEKQKESFEATKRLWSGNPKSIEKKSTAKRPDAV